MRQTKITQMIEEKVIKTLSSEELIASDCIVLSHRDDETPIKILRISNCATWIDIRKIFFCKNFQARIKCDRFLFVIVLEVVADLANLNFEDFLETAFTDHSKPLIISFESKLQGWSRQSSEIYFKEYHERIFKKVHIDKCLSSSEEDECYVSFDLGALLHSLKLNSYGSFNGILLDTTIDYQHFVGNMRIIDRAAFSNNILCLKFLRLFDFDLNEINDANKRLLEIAARSCDFQGFSALLDLPFDCDMATFMQKFESLELLQPHNSNSLNLLMIASESGNAEAVNFLLKCSYDINEKSDIDESAAGLAWQKENYEVFLKLLRENALFPNDFQSKLRQQKERGRVKSILTFITELSSLHENIRRGRMEQVRSFVERNHFTRHAYNIRNESAALTALKSEQFSIYEYLVSQGVCLGPHEDMNEILSEQQQIGCHDGRRLIMKKIVLHEMHKKYFKQPFEKHLMTLLAQSDVGFDISDSEKRGFFKYIKEAYAILDEVEEVSAILKVVANAKFCRIIFDFNRDSVSHVDPTTCKQTKGTSYFKSGYIYIGAKGLVEESQKFEVLGTLAHEMTHYAMQLIYDNNCFPYFKHERERFLEYDMILTVCEFKKEYEAKMFNVFNYPKAHQQAELIVRVPHLLVLYRNNPEKLESCRKTYEELFDFFRNKTLVDLRKEHPLMLPKRELVELNDWFNVVRPLVESDITLRVDTLNLDLDANERIVIVISNCVPLTIKAIHQQLQRDTKFRVESGYLFAKPSVIENAKTKSLLLKAFGMPTKPTIVFECEDDVQPDELKTILDTLNAPERVIFVVKSLDGRFERQEFAHKVLVRHSWTELPESTQNILWKFKVNFQGAEVFLHDLVSFPSKPYEDIPFCDLLRHKLTVSEQLSNNDIDFFIDREFVGDSLEEFNFDAISEYARDNKIVLISDDPGSGKTTTFKTFAVLLKKKFPSHWIAYLDLKQYIDAFEIDDSAMEGENVARFFGEKILQLERFELEIFCQLFMENRVILLLDAIDEICPNFKDFIIGLLKSAKDRNGNQLWVSTRPHVANDLHEALGANYFHLKPFTAIEQRSFYRKFYEHRNVQSTSLNRYINGIEQLMDFLSKNRLFWSPIHGDIISNPLFMRIIADIYDDVVMHRTKTGKCMTLCNLFLMYERFIERKFNLWMSHKGRLSLIDQCDIHRGSKSIMRCHLKIALERTFNDEKVHQHIEKSPLTNEQILRVGLMTQNGHELQFAHRTFAEFFVSDYLFRKIFYHEHRATSRRRARKEKRLVMKLFIRVLSSEEFQMIRAFIGNAMELVKHERDEKRFTKLAKLFRHESKRLDRDKMLTVAVSDGCVNLTSLLLQFSRANQHVLLKLMHLEKRDLNNVLIKSLQIHRSNVDMVKTLWAVATEVYCPKDIKNFLIRVNKDGKTLLHISAACEGPQILTFLVNEIKLVTTESELFDFIMLADGKGESAFEVACKNNPRREALVVLWEVYKGIFSSNELKVILRRMIDNSFETFRTIINNDEEVFGEFWEVLKECLQENEVKRILKTTDSLDMNILQRAATWRCEKVLKNFQQIIIESLTLVEVQELIETSTGSHKSVHEMITEWDTTDKFTCEFISFVKSIHNNSIYSKPLSNNNESLCKDIQALNQERKI